MVSFTLHTASSVEVVIPVVAHQCSITVLNIQLSEHERIGDQIAVKQEIGRNRVAAGGIAGAAPEDEPPVARLIASKVTADCVTGSSPFHTVKSQLKSWKPFA